MELAREADAAGDSALARRVAATVLVAARKSGDVELPKKATSLVLELQKK